MTTAVAIDHVQIAIPAGGEAAGRHFFGKLIGLEELPKPADMAGRGGCWFSLGAQQLHLGVDSDFRPAKKAHVGFVVANLDRLRERLAAEGVATREDEQVADRRRFFADDPFGNRIEFIEARR